jgi:hypothetical protein
MKRFLTSHTFIALVFVASAALALYRPYLLVAMIALFVAAFGFWLYMRQRFNEVAANALLGSSADQSYAPVVGDPGSDSAVSGLVSSDAGASGHDGA